MLASLACSVFFCSWVCGRGDSFGPAPVSPTEDRAVLGRDVPAVGGRLPAAAPAVVGRGETKE